MKRQRWNAGRQDSSETVPWKWEAGSGERSAVRAPVVGGSGVTHHAPPETAVRNHSAPQWRR